MHGGKALALAAFMTAALASPAQAVDYGKWRVTATGSITHKWKLVSDEPCASVGAGRVTASVHGRSKAFRLQYFEQDGFRQWDLESRMRAKGRIRRTDGTRQNPAEDDADPCTPRKRNGCGERRKLHRRAFGSVEGMIPRRRPRITFSFYRLLDAFPQRSRCYTGGFGDFNNFPGIPFTNYGRMVGRMPRPSEIGRRAFTVRFSDRRKRLGGKRKTRTVRHVKLRFRPV
jgi:hypothetical protein